MGLILINGFIQLKGGHLAMSMLKESIGVFICVDVNTLNMRKSKMAKFCIRTTCSTFLTKAFSVTIYGLIFPINMVEGFTRMVNPTNFIVSDDVSHSIVE